jgi:hypothetical protein
MRIDESFIHDFNEFDSMICKLVLINIEQQIWALSFNALTNYMCPDPVLLLGVVVTGYLLLIVNDK